MYTLARCLGPTVKILDIFMNPSANMPSVNSPCLTFFLNHTDKAVILSYKMLHSGHLEAVNLTAKKDCPNSGVSAD